MDEKELHIIGRLPTKGMEGLMDNSSYYKAVWISKVDHLPFGSPYSSNMGIAAECWILQIPHVCENQMGALVGLVHLSEVHILGRPTLQLLKKMLYAPCLH